MYMYIEQVLCTTFQGHHYTIPAASKITGKAPENDSHRVDYSKIDPKSQVPRSVNTLEKQSSPFKNGKNRVLCFAFLLI